MPGSLPERWIRLRVAESSETPLWLTSEDHEWLQVFVSEVRSLEGATLDDFRASFDRIIMPACRASGASPLALRGLAALVPSAWSPGVLSAARPSEIRQILFETAATGVSRREAILKTASVLQIDPESVIPGAFADRSGGRRLKAPHWPVTPSSMARHYNLALARALLLRTTELVVHVPTPGPQFVQSVKEQRLICDWGEDEEGTRLTVSGPAALFRHTTRYGNALLRFFPAVMDSGPWTIEARCVLAERTHCVRMSYRDPIGALANPRGKPRSTPERTVLKAFKGAPGGWTATRDTEALRAGDDIFFPDLRMLRGDDVVRLEWVGFYTPAFIANRMARMKRAGVSAYLLCVDESLGAGPCVDHPQILSFERSIHVARLLERLEGALTLSQSEMEPVRKERCPMQREWAPSNDR